MEAKLVESLPDGEGWQFEPKWDGFRCLVFRDGKDVELQSKAGRPLGRYFPEVVARISALPVDRFALDGELIIPVGGVLSFEALQLRLHPAESRVRKLAAATPAQLMLFDCLEIEGRALIEAPLAERRAALEAFHGRAGGTDLLLSPCTCDRAVALAWLNLAGGALDGVVAKRRDDPYRSGRAGDAQGQAVAHGGLRGRRVPLRGQRQGGRFAAARPLQRRGQARSCRLHLGDPRRRESRADQEAGGAGGAARLHRQRARRAEPLEHRADRQNGCP